MSKGFRDGTMDSDKAITYLSYVGFLFLFPLLLRKNSTFAQFHAKQGLIISILWLFSLTIAPILNKPLSWLLIVLVIFASLVGLWTVRKEEKKRMFLIGDLAAQIKFPWDNLN